MGNRAFDPVLTTWGRNIRRQREALRPIFDADGRITGAMPRMGRDDPMLTAEQLGQLMSPPVVQSTVSRWENGLAEPRRAYKAQLAKVLLANATLLFPVVAA